VAEQVYISTDNNSSFVDMTNTTNSMGDECCQIVT
jgi:hypothetical protein